MNFYILTLFPEMILNGLGFIVSYITPFFAGGKWGTP